MPHKVVGVGLVCPPTGEVTINCATSLLLVQQAAARRAHTADRVQLEVTISDSVNAAINGMMQIPEVDTIVLIDATVGFPPEFLFDALDSNLDVVVGVHPLPRIDWEGVKAAVAANAVPAADLHLAGLSYNVRLLPASPPPRYAPIDPADLDADVFGLLVVRRAVLETMRAAFPEHAYNDGAEFMYACEDVVRGVRRSPSARFVGMLGAAAAVHADTERQATKSGTAEFAGCVGMRGGGAIR